MSFITCIHKLVVLSSVEERGGKPVKITGPSRSEVVQGPTMMRMFCLFSVVSLFVDLKINRFGTSPSHSVVDDQYF